MNNKINEMINEAKRLLSIGSNNEAVDLLYEAAESVICEDALPARLTGLNHDIWIDPPGKDRGNEHSLPRIKIYIKDGSSISTYPVIFNKDGTITIKNENKIKGSLHDEKDFIINNLDLFKIQFNYPHIFSAKKFKIEFLKYINGKYTKQQLIDILFDGYEEEKPDIL